MGDTLYKDTYWMLRNTMNYLKNDLRDKIESNGISWQQFHALYHLNEKGVQSNELAKELSCNASNMTGLIDRMTENGWVYREHSEDDRRVWFVKLTDKGVNLRNKLLPQHLDNIKQCMGSLSEEELRILQGLLSKLTTDKNMEDQNERV